MASYKLTERAKKNKNGDVVGTEKCIIAEYTKLSIEDKAIVDVYVKNGYHLYSPKKKKAGKGLTKEKMIAHLKEIGDEEGLKELEKKVKAKENFMKLTSWYKKHCEEK